MKKLSSVAIYFAKNISIVIGLVLIWRGIWHVMDTIDNFLFGGNPIFSSVGGVILGLLILYIPDHDLKEIQKL